MKYIIIYDSGIEIPVIFPNLTSHSNIAAGKKVVAAGQVDIDIHYGYGNEVSIRVDCSGRSLGLNVSSRPQDAKLIEKSFNY